MSIKRPLVPIGDSDGDDDSGANDASSIDVSVLKYGSLVQQQEHFAECVAADNPLLKQK